MKSTDKKKKASLASNELEMKLEDFYDSFDAGENFEKLEDVRHLVRENEELLRKVDTLIEILLRAARELGEDEEQKVVLEQISEKLKTLEDLREKLEGYSADFAAIDKSVEELKAVISSSVSQSLSAVVPGINRISERVESLADRTDKLDKLDALDDLYRKNSEFYDQMTALPTSIESAVYRQVESVREKLAALHERLESLTELRGNVESLRESISSLTESDAKISSELEEGFELVEDVNAGIQNISERVGELKSSLSEVDSKLREIEDLRSRLDALVLAIDKIPDRVGTAIEDHSNSIKSKLDSIPTGLSKDIKKGNSLIVSRIEELENRLSDMEGFRKEIADIKKMLKSSREEEHRWMAHQFDILEREVESLSLALGAIQKAFSGSIDERKSAIAALTKRTEGIIEALHKIRTVSSREEEERLRRLQESTRSMFLSISESLSKISEQEKKGSEIFGDYVRHIDERMDKLEKLLEEDAMPSTVQAVRGELSELSKKLANLADLVHVNTSLLKVRSGDVAELIARFQALDEKLSRVEDGISKVPSVLVETQRVVEKDLEKLRDGIADGMRELRKHKDSDIVKEYRTLKEALSTIHAELAGVLEIVKKYNVTENLDALSRRLEEIHLAVEEGRGDHSAVNRELADIEEHLSKITSTISESDVRAVKSRLDDIYRAVDGISKRVKNASAVLSEGELKDVVHNLELLRVQIRKLRDAGLVDELGEVRGKVKNLRSALESEIEAVKKGAVHHSVITSHHSDVRELVAPVADVSSAIRAVANAKESTAKKIKSVAKDIAKKSSSTHAHIVASHSDRLIRTAKAMKDVEKVVEKIQKKVDKVDAEISSKQGGKAKQMLSDIANRDVDAAVAAKLVKIFKRMHKGESRTSQDLANDLRVREDLVKRVLDRISAMEGAIIRVKKPLPVPGGPYIVTKL